MGGSKAAEAAAGTVFYRERSSPEAVFTSPTAEATLQVRSERNTVIDVLRGLCIVSMLAGHFGSDTYLRYWTHLPRFFDGAAGFVFLSGFVLGSIHLRRLQKQGERAASAAIWKRAGLLWAVHVLLTLFVFGLHQKTGRIAAIPSVETLGGWGKTLWLIATLQMQPFGLGLDILPLYAIFLLASPLILALLIRGCSIVPLLASFLLYLSVQFRPEALNLLDPRSGAVAFYWAAWQFLFTLGLMAGWQRERLQAALAGKWRTPLLIVSGTLSAVFLVLAQLDLHSVFHPLHPALARLYAGFDKPTLGGLQVLYFFAALLPGYLLLRRLMRTEGGRRVLSLLETMGRLSLYCFLVHLGYTFSIRALSTETWTPLQQEGVSLIGLIFVGAMARFGILRRWIPN